MNRSFRTILSAPSPTFEINHRQALLLIGSCFTEHIGRQLEARKFQTFTNPFGIVYNPESMVSCLERLLAGNQAFTEEELFENAGLWHSWEHHGRFSHPERAKTLAAINEVYARAAAFLTKTDVLLLTFGTSDVFVLKETAKVVANNHKMPAVHFETRRLSVDEIVVRCAHALNALREKSPDIKVVLTVSPVRHIRSGLIENQRSKARLVLACEELESRLDFVHYFPAYELLLDDLRDYRFYDTDMLHPSETAVQYTWEYFSDSFFSEKTKSLNERIEKIGAAARHRPFHPDTAQHRAFQVAQLEVIATIEAEMPGLDFSMEKQIFKP